MAPIDLIYKHLHNRIKLALDEQLKKVIELGDLQNPSHVPSALLRAHGQLQRLQDNYLFLEQVYKYHSLVEDEVVYPLLDSKVKNVTLPYTVEHEDEGRLFEELTSLVSQALTACAAENWDEGVKGIRQLTYKVEEVHTCIQRHLAKEEEQLHPLLLRHCSDAEQASLIAQFLFCIPLSSIERVLTWLQVGMDDSYRTELLQQVTAILSDEEGDVIVRLVTAWLSAGHPTPSPLHAATPPDESDRTPPGALAAKPILFIGLVHEAIRRSLEEFRLGVRALRARPHPWSLLDLQQLVDRHRHLRAVCMFHSDSEKDVLLPVVEAAAAHRGGGGGPHSHAHSHAHAHAHGHTHPHPHPSHPHGTSGGDAAACYSDHAAHVELFEDLSRLLMESVLHTRRGTSKAEEVSSRLMDRAEHVVQVITDHLKEEEDDVLPLLGLTLSLQEQRRLVWRTLKAMPLRLLKRVLPLMGATALERGSVSELNDLVLRAGREQGEEGLIELFQRWMAETGAGAAAATTDATPLSSRADLGLATPLVTASRGPGSEEPASKRPRVQAESEDGQRRDSGGLATTSDRPWSPSSAALPPTRTGGSFSPKSSPSFNPIDHIFQFHKALRQELAQLESDAASLDPLKTDGPPFQDELKRLDGRFQFLWGIYRAHSKAEDEVIFPALESREHLHNVSHAYVLDHMEEEKLFIEFDRAMGSARQTPAGLEHHDTLVRWIERLRGICAAIRASIDTHVRSEEMGLWPLFVEHFSSEEQEQLVGTIIGKTGAEALQSMLAWMSQVFTDEERGELIESLRLATKNTMFDRWLDATFSLPSLDQDPDLDLHGAAPNTVGADDGVQSLEELAQYLRQQCPSVVPRAGGEGGAAGASDGAPPPPPSLLEKDQAAWDRSGAVEDNSQYRPGWEDIFRMNQHQLERAVRALSSDPNLEPQRKAYLMQNLMASKYIVAQQLQQRRHRLAFTASTTASEGGERGGEDASGPGPARASRPPPPAAAPASRQGCEHYARRCSIVAPCCGASYACRLCHDEGEAHKVDRYAIREMTCSACSLRQTAAQLCSGCGESMARYYCSICHLWDDEPGRDIYHCPFCNVCRRGKGLGVDFFHCMQCNSCMSLSLFNKHKCRQRSLEANCPVCHEYLFDSSSPVKELRCGHFMHSGCFASYKNYAYTCPMCFKSMGDMGVYFEMLDALMAAEEPLPGHYRNMRQRVHCNDCGKETDNTPFHFVYHKCGACRSYNTRVLATTTVVEGGGVVTVDGVPPEVGLGAAAGASGLAPGPV